MIPAFPPYSPLSLVQERLPLIFPEGTANRNNCIKGSAASTVFTAIYIGALESYSQDLGPVHVYRMTQEQSELTSDADRLAYFKQMKKKVKSVPGTRWYADNSRETIRDEALKEGLVSIGAFVRRSGMATTSGLPRYVLKDEFAALFDPALTGDEFEQAVLDFRATHLSKSALARVSIMLSGAVGGSTKVLVNFPSGETRHLEAGPSSIISKAVIEVFAPAFMTTPFVLWLSESGNKVVVRDDTLAAKVGIIIDPKTTLPDMILVDLGAKEPLLVFVEVVATDGPISPARKDAFLEIIEAAGFDPQPAAFLTAYSDRQSAGYKKTGAHLAWGSYAWFVSEPENILIMQDDPPVKLHDMI